MGIEWVDGGGGCFANHVTRGSEHSQHSTQAACFRTHSERSQVRNGTLRGSTCVMCVHTRTLACVLYVPVLAVEQYLELLSTHTLNLWLRAVCT